MQVDRGKSASIGRGRCAWIGRGWIEIAVWIESNGREDRINCPIKLDYVYLIRFNR